MADPRSHPAVVAWRVLNPDAGAPAAVQMLQEGIAANSVYRIVPAGGGPPVIAKRGAGAMARVERTVYEEVLHRLLSSPGPPFYGAVAQSGEIQWLFTGEVSGRAYHQDDPTHQVAAARWLGALHTGITWEAKDLPDRSVAHYIGLLGATGRFVRARLLGDALSPREVGALKTILGHFERLESHLATLAEYCEAGPDTLVHGDLVAHNLYVGHGGRDATVVAIDWEKAGWGTPAEDLSSVDLPTYCEVVRHRWPQLDLAVYERLALAGRFFRCLVFLDWVLPRLSLESHDAPVEDLEQCGSWLGDLRASAGW